jgi:hypothetical protein
MAVRHSVGIALALVVGVAIGYAASPSAQNVSTVAGGPTSYQAISVRVEAVSQGRVSVTVQSDDSFELVGQRINLWIEPSRLIVKPTDQSSMGRVYDLPRR